MLTESLVSGSMDGSRANRARRPVLVWVILIFYAFSMLSLVALALMRLPGHPLGEAASSARIYTWFDYLESYGLAALKLAAAVELFRLRRVAVKLFFGIFSLNLLATGYDLFSKGHPSVGLTGVLVGFAIFMSICLYSWWLERKGVLGNGLATA